MERLPHVIETQQFTVPWLEENFFPLVYEMEKLLEAREKGLIVSPVRPDLTGKNIVEFFYGASTRTRLTFEFAARELGAVNFTTDNAGISSSAAKDESLRDTIKIISGYPTVDAIVLRTPIESPEKSKEELNIKKAVIFSSKPIVNAGDRNEQHPTQTLIDLYTIRKEKGCIAGLTIGIGGDVGGSRTVKSLIYLGAKYGVKFIIISPSIARIPEDLRDYLTRHKNDLKVEFEEHINARDYAHLFDVYYVVRIQTEGLQNINRSLIPRYEPDAFWSANQELLKLLPKDAIIIDPLPRTQIELPYETDNDPRSVYFKQAKYGEAVRMALLLSILKEPYRTNFLQKTNPPL